MFLLGWSVVKDRGLELAQPADGEKGGRDGKAKSDQETENQPG